MSDQPGDHDDVAAGWCQKPTHKVARDPSSAPIVRNDIGVATAIADVGRQRHDRNSGADLADLLCDRIALRDGQDQPVKTLAQVADRPTRRIDGRPASK